MSLDVLRITGRLKRNPEMCRLASGKNVTTLTSARRSHGYRRRWTPVVVFVLVALVVFTFVSTWLLTVISHGGPYFWWDLILGVVRDIIRNIWSTLTGQPLTKDLFPSDFGLAHLF